MAKKYLLYIHHPGFEKEKKKSDLVNQLLDSYYEVTAPSNVKSALAAGFSAIKDPEQAISIVEDLVPKLCGHGADPKFCRFAKPGKQCKLKP